MKPLAELLELLTAQAPPWSLEAIKTVSNRNLYCCCIGRITGGYFVQKEHAIHAALVAAGAIHEAEGMK